MLIVRVVKEGTTVAIEGTQVSARSHPDEPDSESTTPQILPTVHTDERGMAKLELAAGIRHVLRAGPSFFQRPSGEQPIGWTERGIGPLLPGQRAEALVELPFGEDLVFWGRIQSGLTGAPIPGVRIVELSSGGRATSGLRPEKVGSSGGASPFQGELSATSDTDGLFEVRTHSWSPGAFVLESPGFGLRVFSPEAGHESPDQACFLKLQPSAMLRARVVGPGASGAITPAVWVSADWFELGDPDARYSYLAREALRNFEPTWFAECDASGTCTIADLPARIPLDVEIYGVGVERRIPDGLTLEPGEVREAEWILGGGARLYGAARYPEGSVASGITLWLLAESTVALPEARRCLLHEYWEDAVIDYVRTDDEGSFEFEDVAPGRWWLGPRPRRHDRDGASPEAVAVEIPPGLPELGIDMVIHRGLYIRGRVVAPDGQTSADAGVHGACQDFPGWLEAGNELDGTFELGPLSPGRYTLVAYSSEPSTSTESDPVTAEAGEGGVVLRLQEGGSMSGRVVDRRTREARKATLSYSTGFGEQLRVRMQETPDDGSFGFHGFPPGRYELAAVTEEGLVGLLRGVEVVAGSDTTNLVVEVEPGARLRVRYEGETDSCQYGLYQGGIPFAFHSLPRRTTAKNAVPAGEIEVVIFVGGQEVERKQLRLEVGEETEVLLAPRD